MISYRRNLLIGCDLRGRHLPAEMRVDLVAALANIPRERLHGAISGRALRDDEWRELSRILKLGVSDLRAFVGQDQARRAEYEIRARGGRV